MSKDSKCCLGCDEREIGCHSWCERYKRRKAREDIKNARRRAEREADVYVGAITAKNFDYAAKRKRDSAGRAKPSGR